MIFDAKKIGDLQGHSGRIYQQTGRNELAETERESFGTLSQ
jgi:hypothetical protein